MNVVVLVGRLTKDPEMKFTDSGTTIASMRIAVDRAGEKQADGIGPGFFNVTCWNRQAELCEQYLHKGSQAAFSGSLRYREWEAKDGTTRREVDVNAFQVQFLGSKSDGETAAARPPAGNPDETAQTGFGADDIPF